MRPSVPLATLLFAIPSLADFHIGRADKETNPFARGDPVIKWTDYVACPSNYFGCQCYGYFSATADRGVSTRQNKAPTGNFSINSGLCSAGQLDFYYRSSQNVWEFYKNGGDGTKLGTCYPNSGHDLCFIRTGTALTVNYYEALVCISDVCDPTKPIPKA